MTRPPSFELVPIARLRAHEQYVEETVREVIVEIRRRGVFDDPVWVAADSYVVINGHHRTEAMRRMGAACIPAWVFDYDSEAIAIEPWRPGPPIPKAEVVRRALAGELFPPKSTRHHLRVSLPPRSVPLDELLPSAPGGPAPRAPDRVAR